MEKLYKIASSVIGEAFVQSNSGTDLETSVKEALLMFDETPEVIEKYAPNERAQTRLMGYTLKDGELHYGEIPHRTIRLQQLQNILLASLEFVNDVVSFYSKTMLQNITHIHVMGINSVIASSLNAIALNITFQLDNRNIDVAILVQSLHLWVNYFNKTINTF